MFWTYIKEDIQAVFERDPAVRSKCEVVFAYPGFHAVLVHRGAHWLWTHGRTTVARIVSHLSRFLTGALLGSVPIFYVMPALAELSQLLGSRSRTPREKTIHELTLTETK